MRRTAGPEPQPHQPQNRSMSDSAEMQCAQTCRAQGHFRFSKTCAGKRNLEARVALTAPSYSPQTPANNAPPGLVNPVAGSCAQPERGPQVAAHLPPVRPGLGPVTKALSPAGDRRSNFWAGSGTVQRNHAGQDAPGLQAYGASAGAGGWWAWRSWGWCTGLPAWGIRDLIQAS